MLILPDVLDVVLPDDVLDVVLPDVLDEIGGKVELVGVVLPLLVDIGQVAAKSWAHENNRIKNIRSCVTIQ